MHRLTLFFLALSAPVLAQQIAFVDRADEAGIGFRHISGATPDKYLIETMGGGVALLDYDSDGLLDLFFVNSGPIAEEQVRRTEESSRNRLYRNNGDGTFEDRTAGSGLETAPKGRFGMGAAVGDFDNDGFSDLVVTGVGAAELFRNGGDGRFEPVEDFAAPGWSASAGFLDYDQDGLLDLFVARYLDWDFDKHVECGGAVRMYCPPAEHEPVTNLLYRNLGGGRFQDVSAEAGLAELSGKSLGVAFNDADGDGDPDIVVANDAEPQQLLLNDGDGTFTEDGMLSGLAYNEDGGSFAGMGVDFQDYDNDLLPDAIITNLARELYALYRNEGGASFQYSTRQTNLAAITARMSGWGTLFADFDLDGWKDLFVAQGHVLDTIAQTDSTLVYRQPPLLASNVEGKFVDASSAAGPTFRRELAGRGAAFGDLDNDGDIDVAVGVLDSEPLLLYNETPRGGRHWLTVALEGRRSPRDGQGATVTILTASGAEQTRFVTTAGSYLSASDGRAHFGLGSDDVVEWVRVEWPSGTEQRVEDVRADRVLRLGEP